MSGRLWWTLLTVALPAAYVLLSRWRRRRAKKTLGDPRKEFVIIIGASSGIGKCLALKYAARGTSLLLVARRQSLLEDVQKECQDQSSSFQSTIGIYAADASNEADIARIAQYAQKTYETSRATRMTLVICMGVLSVLTFEDMCALPTSDTAPDLRSIMESIFQVNVFGPILLSKHFLPLLKNCRGKLVVVSSIAGVFGAPTRTLYASTKFALNGFLDSLRIEWQRFGIPVVNVLPGSVDTGLRNAALDSSPTSSQQGPGNKTGMSPEACAQVILEAADAETRQVFVPAYYEWVQWLKFFVPDWIDRQAAKKYGYSLN